MCIWIFAICADGDRSLVMAGNRDEFYERPTQPAGFWEDCPRVLAGRDGSAQGTWMGITRDGRFSLVTNFRDPAKVRADAASRGHLVSDFLCGDSPAAEYAKAVGSRAGRFNPFNLLAGDAGGIFWISDQGEGAQKVAPGVHGLSNALLDTPWPKVERARSALAGLLGNPPEKDEELARGLFAILSDNTPAPDAELPDTGVGPELERMLSPVFVKMPGYGTRASTVLLLHRDGRAYFEERCFGPEGPVHGLDRRFRFHTGPDSKD